MSYRLDCLVVYFFIYSFLGYLTEVAYCSVGKRKLVNRGFLFGPYLPIYGSGALLIHVAFTPISEYPIAVFILSFTVTSAIEYVTHWALEKLFSVKLWDYSKYGFIIHKGRKNERKILTNLNGRVCLRNSVMFGALGLFVVYVLSDRIERIVSLIPAVALRYVSESIAIIMISDTVLSVMRMIEFKKAIEKAKELRKEMSKEIKADAEAALIRHRKQMDEKFAYLAAKYPGMTAIGDDLKSVVSDYKKRTELRRNLRKDWIETKKNEIKEGYVKKISSAASSERKTLKSEMKESLKSSLEEFLKKVYG